MKASTNEKDKLPALSSIASLHGKMTGDRHIAGLWQSRLPRLLLWRRSYVEYDRPSKWRAPSWSPLCVDGPVIFGLTMTPPSFEEMREPVDTIRARRKQRDEITVPKFDFIDASVSLQSTEVTYGRVTNATLEVRGKLVRYQSESNST